MWQLKKQGSHSDLYPLGGLRRREEDPSPHHVTITKVHKNDTGLCPLGTAFIPCQSCPCQGSQGLHFQSVPSL